MMSRRPGSYDNDEEAQELCQQLFHALDSNMDGALQAQELSRALETFSVTYHQHMSNMDEDEDGNVSWEEFQVFHRCLYDLEGRTSYMKMIDVWLGSLATLCLKEIGLEVGGLPPEIEPAGPPGSKPVKGKRVSATGHGSDPTVSSVKFAKSAPRKSVTRKSVEAGESAAPSALRKSADDVAQTRDDAAIKIQRQARRASTTGGAPGRRRSSVSAAEPQEESLTSLEEVWELLTTEGGRVSTKMRIEDLGDLYYRAYQTGLDRNFVQKVPQRFETFELPIEVFPTQFNHLVAMVTAAGTKTANGVDLGEDVDPQRARDELRQIRDSARKQYEAGGRTVQDREATINLLNFKKLIPLFCEVARIEQSIFLSHMAWAKTGRFEMPTEMFTAIRMALHPENPMAGINREDFMIVLAAIGCIDDDEKRKGVDIRVYKTGPQQAVFDDIIENMPQLLQMHADSHPGIRSAEAAKIPKAKAKRKDVGITGSTEFSVLLKEVFDNLPAKDAYKSPLYLSTLMYEKGAAGELGDD